jgi:hypothetical protein
VRIGDVAAGSSTAAVANCDPWLLWTVMAYTVSIAFKREGANGTGSPRRSNTAANFPGAVLTTTPASPLYRSSP